MTRIVGLLLLGAAVNVAVAWGCALGSPERARGWEHTSARRLYQASQITSVETVEGFGFTVRTVTTLIMRPSGERRSAAADGLVFLYPESCVVESEAGWPLRCFAGTEESGKPSGLWRVGQVAQPITFQAALARPINFERALPLGVRWRALAINTLALGSLSLAIVVVPARLRTWRRSRRGLCVLCAYPVRELAACPECGREVRGVGGDACVGPVSGGARVAGGVAAPVVMESASARGEEGKTDGVGMLTTPEGVAYERASPLKRAGERAAVGAAAGRTGAEGAR